MPDDRNVQVPDEMLIEDCLPPRELFPAGQYAAICYAVVALGTQKVQKFQSNETYLTQKLCICWEFPKLRIEIEDQQGNLRNLPRSRRQFYSFSLSEKSNLRKMLESWRGEGFTTDEMKKFNIFSIIGVPAFIQIIHEKREDGSANDKMNNIMPLPEEMQAALGEMENPPLKFAYNKAAGVWPLFPENMPEYMRNAVYDSQEWIAQKKKEEAGGTVIEGAEVPAQQPKKFKF